eukprot:CAMPEP_0198712608 /NCGR_PEP_ID=MMETSP1471-20131121/4362_1 /TAXON_ID=41880 /ORGANISM="Pycnococcus provasolii, Strain RCC733" /LENGTH=100 /DNA_ID=CAMNT_0044472591 /DNA_START=190 /DNA_END=489 /DNA_ORIENTATION=+
MPKINCHSGARAKPSHEHQPPAYASLQSPHAPLHSQPLEPSPQLPASMLASEELLVRVRRAQGEVPRECAGPRQMPPNLQRLPSRRCEAPRRRHAGSHHP